MTEQICKKCLLSEIDEKDVLESIRIRIEKLNSDERCNTEQYRQRLSLCKLCDHLISGVCQKCGCYVEFRAAFKNKKCPDVSDRKW